MIDINFYRKIHSFKEEIEEGKIIDGELLFNKFEGNRSKNPIIFNIETTNNCNMKCIFCPRTTEMNREIETLDIDTYKKVIEQIKPWSKEDWDKNVIEARAKGFGRNPEKYWRITHGKY